MFADWTTLLPRAYSCISSMIQQVDDEWMSEAHEAAIHALTTYRPDVSDSFDSWFMLCVRQRINQKLRKRVSPNIDPTTFACRESCGLYEIIGELNEPFVHDAFIERMSQASLSEKYNFTLREVRFQIGYYREKLSVMYGERANGTS